MDGLPVTTCGGFAWLLLQVHKSSFCTALSLPPPEGVHYLGSLHASSRDGDQGCLPLTPGSLQGIKSVTMARNGAGRDQDPHRHRQKLGLDPEPTTQQLAQPTCTYVVQCRLIAWEWPQCFVLSKAVLKGRKLKPSFLRSSQTEFKAKCLFCLPHDEAPATRAPVLTLGQGCIPSWVRTKPSQPHSCPWAATACARRSPSLETQGGSLSGLTNCSQWPAKSPFNSSLYLCKLQGADSGIKPAQDE